MTVRSGRDMGRWQPKKEEVTNGKRGRTGKGENEKERTKDGWGPMSVYSTILMSKVSRCIQYCRYR